MHRSSEEKKSPHSQTAGPNHTINDKANLPIPITTLLGPEDQIGTIYQALIGIIIKGNFRAILLPTFRRLVAGQSSDTNTKILALLLRLYDFRNHKLPHSTGRNRNFRYPPLDLSSSGFSDSFLTELIKRLKVQYCNSPQVSKGLPGQPAEPGAFLQHIDLSNNHLRPTPRGARQLVPSVAQHLAVWLSNPTCRLQTLNLSDNPALGGSTKTFDPYLKSIGYGSDIYHIVLGLRQNNSLELLKMVNTGINLVDFEELAQMLGDNAVLRVVDISNNPISVDGRPHLNAMLEKRSKNHWPTLNLELADTSLVEPVAVLGGDILQIVETQPPTSVSTPVPPPLALVKTVPIDPAKVVNADNPLEAFQLELSLQLQYLNFKSVGNGIFAEYKPEKYPHELEYYLKLLQIVILILGGAVAVATPLSALIGSIAVAMGIAVSTAGITHKVGRLINDLNDLSQSLTPEMDELFSFESIHLLYEAGKDGFKTGTKSYAQFQKLKELGIKLKKGSPAAKKTLDNLHCQYKAIAKLFLQDETLQTKIMMSFSHAYHSIIVRLSTEEAVRFAKDLAIPIKTGLLGLAICSPLVVEEIPHLLLKHFQLMPLEVFRTLRFRNVVHQGYVRQREKSFNDIFGITRAEALKQIMDHPRPDDFQEITVSLSEFLVNRAPNKYHIPVLPIIVDKSYRPNIYNNLSDSFGGNDFKFTLTRLIAIHRDPREASSATERQLAILFFTLQTGGEDECCWHPALLQALARIKGFTLKIWEYGPKNASSLVPYFEKSCASYEHPGSTKRIDCVDESEVEKSEHDGHVTVAIKFSQVRFEGNDAPPSLEKNQNVFPDTLVPALSYDQMRENESSMVWVRDLLQRSGWVCAGDIRFDISKRLQSQAGNKWTQTDRAKFGCLRANQAMLDTVNKMINEYKAQVSRAHYSIFYNNQYYQITSLTPRALHMPVLKTMLDDTLSTAIGQMKEHYNTIRTLIKPLIEAEFLSESSPFPYTLWCASSWSNMLRPWSTYELQEAFNEYHTARFLKTTYYTRKLKSYADDPLIVDKFLQFALEKRQLYGGWVHANILRALAIVLNIHLEFYQLDECGDMSPHPSYTNVCPAQPKKTVRLLYLDTHSYVLLSLPEVQPGIPEKLFKWTSDNALVSACGLYKLSVATLKELAQKEELRAIESEWVLEDLKREVRDLKGTVQEVKAAQEKHGTKLSGVDQRVTNLEQNEVVKPEDLNAVKQELIRLRAELQASVAKTGEAVKFAELANKRADDSDLKLAEMQERVIAAEKEIRMLKGDHEDNSNTESRLQDGAGQRVAQVGQVNLLPQRRVVIPNPVNNDNNVQGDLVGNNNLQHPDQGGGNQVPQPQPLGILGHGIQVDRDGLEELEPGSQRGFGV